MVRFSAILNILKSIMKENTMPKRKTENLTESQQRFQRLTEISQATYIAEELESLWHKICKPELEFLLSKDTPEFEILIPGENSSLFVAKVEVLVGKVIVGDRDGLIYFSQKFTKDIAGHVLGAVASLYLQIK